MSENNNASLEATPEQVLYANLLNKGMLIGLILLFVTFFIYIFGIMKPYIPIEELSNYWGLSVTEYLKTANIPTGWGWVDMLGFGDFVNFLGIVVLSGVTILCYLAIVPTLLKSGDKVYAVLALIEVAVLSLAASGVLVAGH
ncbi:MAG: DUF1634 domain-containing protein [Proteobacteria bacterium]|nr:DUF1634 domain-containing protein [Pseudomonadota bacterium]